MHKKILALCCFAAFSGPASALIGGEASEVYPEVVRLQAGEKVCTGTIIGPRTILSAAHCVTEDSPFFMHKGQRYPVKYLVSGAKDKGHDVALAVTDTNIKGAIFARLGRGLKHGMKVIMAGFGCTRRGGKPGALHVGQTRVIGMDEDHMLAASKHGSVLCEGDSGGPSFVSDGGSRRLIGVSSLSDIRKLNLNVRLDSRLSHAFLKTAARLYRLEICGITASC